MRQCDDVRRRHSSAGGGASATSNYCSCGHWRFHFGRSNRSRPRRHSAALPVNEIKNERFRADLDRASGAELDRAKTRAAFWKRRRRDRRLRISADGKCARSSDRLAGDLLGWPLPTAAVISAKFLDVCRKNLCWEKAGQRALFRKKGLEEQRVRRQEQGRAGRRLHQA